MRSELLTTVCALSLLLGANSALAGAYGEPPVNEEAPAPPPAPPAVVEEEMNCAALGPYVGLGALYAVELFDDGPLGAATDNSWGFELRGGYRFHPNFAAELLYQYYADFDTDPGHLDGWSVSANLKGYLMTGRVQPYGLLGLGFIAGNGSGGNYNQAAKPGDDFMMRFGGGLDVCITEHISMGPEFAYILPTSDAQDLDMLTVSLGMNYRF